MKFLLAILCFISFSLWIEEVYSKEKSSKKGKGKKKQYLCPSIKPKYNAVDRKSNDTIRVD